MTPSAIFKASNGVLSPSHIISHLLGLSPPSIFLSLLYLPSLPLLGLPYWAGGFSFRDALAVARNTQWQRRAQVGEGPGRARSLGSPLAAAVAVAAAVAAAAAGEAAPCGQHQNWSVI